MSFNNFLHSARPIPLPPDDVLVLELTINSPNTSKSSDPGIPLSLSLYHTKKLGLIYIKLYDPAKEEILGPGYRKFSDIKMLKRCL